MSHSAVGLKSVLLVAGFGLSSFLPSPITLRAEDGRIGHPCPTSRAEHSLLAIVAAEARPGQAYPMSVRLDEQGDITQLQYEGSRVGTVCFSVADLSRGAVIMNTDSRDIIRLRVGSEFSAKDGGSVTLSYLKNGVSGRYENFTMELVRSGSWHLEENSRTFNRLYFENHHGIFGMVIGVKRPEATFSSN